MSNIFKDYNGEVIDFNNIKHTHSISNTVRDGNIAYADIDNDGFMRKEDFIKLEELEQNANLIKDKMKNMVFIKHYPSSTLIKGSDFSVALETVGPLCTSVVFTKEPIPVDKVSSAKIVSTPESETKTYMYLNDNIVYVSPEEKDTTIYANENCNSMFYYCNGSFIDLSNFDTSNVIDMSAMFSYCTKLTSVDLSNIDTTNVTNMTGIFISCTSLTNIILPKYTSKVTSISSMFYKCTSLVTLDLSNIDTTSVTDMSKMFENCTSLTNIILPKYTSNVISVYNMFYNCTSLTSLDLSRWDTSMVTNMSYMFSNCSNLVSIKGISEFNTSNVTSMSNMFFNCKSLTSLDLSYWDTFKVKNISNMFSQCSNLLSLNLFSTTYEVTNMSGIFNYCDKLTSINISTWDTSKVTNMSIMFRGCSSLNVSDIESISSWETYNVTDMSGMFEATNIINLDFIMTWDISSVTNMNNMFNTCRKLTDISSIEVWDPGNVTSMRFMFSRCDLISDFSPLYDWGISNVTDMGYMFSYTNITNLDFMKIWNTLNLTDMHSMFEGCKNLSNISTLSKFKTSKVKDMANLFRGCISLTSVDLSNLDTTNVTNMSSMFENCTNLTSLDLSNFNTFNVTNMSYMFSNCNKLQYIQRLFDWNTLNVTDMRKMFYNCANLQAEFIIRNSEIKYDQIFYNTSTTSSSIFNVWYTNSQSKEIARNMINTKTTDSKVSLKQMAICHNGTIFNNTLKMILKDHNNLCNNIKFLSSPVEPGIGDTEYSVEDPSSDISILMRYSSEDNNILIYPQTENTIYIEDCSYMFSGLNLPNTFIDTLYLFLTITKDTSSMFENSNVSALVTFVSPNIVNYSNMFKNSCQNENSIIYLQYIDKKTKDLTDSILLEYSTNPNIKIKENYQYSFIQHTPVVKDSTGEPSSNIFIEDLNWNGYNSFKINPRGIIGEYSNSRIILPNINLYRGMTYALLIQDQSYFKVSGIGLGTISQSDILKETSSGKPILFDITPFNPSVYLIGTNLSEFKQCYFIKPLINISELCINYNYTIESPTYNEILRIGLFDIIEIPLISE